MKKIIKIDWSVTFIVIATLLNALIFSFVYLNGGLAAKLCYDGDCIVIPDEPMATTICVESECVKTQQSKENGSNVTVCFDAKCVTHKAIVSGFRIEVEQ